MAATAVADRQDDVARVAPLRVLIADDHPLMLAGLRRTLEHSEDIEIVGEAHSGPELLKMIEHRLPGMVLTDLRMPGLSGSECVTEILTRWPLVKVVVLSASDDRASIDSALNAGASAYIVKSIHPPDIASVLRQAADTSIVFHATPRAPSVIGYVPVEEPEGPGLTDREQTILTAVAAGLTTTAISRELWISEHTVKYHLTNIYRKIGVPNRAAAVRYALENGLTAA